jgi:hypothetical protein
MPRENGYPELPRFLRPESQPAAVRSAVVLAFLLATAFSVWRVAQFLHDPAVSVKAPQGLIDFHHVVYFPAVAFRDGVNPYSQEYADAYPVNRRYPPYSPGMFVVNCPFAFMPLEVANVVYYVANWVMIIALAASALALCRVSRTLVSVLGLTTLILLSRPGHINLLLGQFTLPIVLGAVWALQLARSRPWLAGVGLAIATLKPTFGVPLVWLMFCRRDFRAVFAGVSISGMLAIVGIAPFIARDGLQSVVDSFRASASLHEADPIVDPQTTWTRLDALALVAKAGSCTPPPSMEFGITAACLLAAGFAVWRTSRGPLAIGADSISALIIFAATLACIYHSTYDALLLVVPWIGAAVGLLRAQLPAALRAVTWLLLTIPAVNYLSADEVMRRLSIEGPLWTALTAINSLCVLAVLLLAIYVALRPSSNRA